MGANPLRQRFHCAEVSRAVIAKIRLGVFTVVLATRLLPPAEGQTPPPKANLPAPAVKAALATDRPTTAVRFVHPNLPSFEGQTATQDAASSATPQAAPTAASRDMSFLADARRFSALSANADNASSSVWRLRMRRPQAEPAMRTDATTPSSAGRTPPGLLKPKEEEKTALDINTATVEELMILEGMDERRARSVALFRQAHKGFKAVDDLSDVFGITDEQVDRWRKSLRAGPGPK